MSRNRRRRFNAFIKLQIIPKLVGFEVLTAVVMKSSIFWDITPCSPLKVNQRFGGTYRLHLQCRYRLLSRWFLALLIFRP
jgi:hypothetical protein